jgi:septum formation inhibitor MinC
MRIASILEPAFWVIIFSLLFIYCSRSESPILVALRSNTNELKEIKELLKDSAAQQNQFYLKTDSLINVHVYNANKIKQRIYTK